MTVAEMVATLWKGKWLIVVVTVVATGTAAMAAFMLPKRYTAVAVVMPAQSQQGAYGSLGALASRYGGLASIAGISLPSDSSASEAIATLQSDGLTIAFIRDNNLLPILFSGNWDAVAGRWKTGEPPTVLGAAGVFRQQVRSVSQDSKSGMIYVGATWKDPEVAATWANDLVEAANSHLRQRAISQAERNIEYLKAEILKTNVVELRSAMYSLMESEIQKAMLARGNEEFALRVVDSALAPEVPSFPRPAILVPLGFICGLFISVLLVMIRGFLRGDQA